MIILRPYQEEGFSALKNHISNSFESCVLEAATGAGKSLIIAKLSEWLWNVSNKRVLCLAPSKELVEQNFKKFIATGNPASMFSASTGHKSLRHPVVFGTPQTVANSLERFGGFAAIIIDEAHGITPTIKKIIEDLKEKNPKLRVIGLTATPYRTVGGYIYQIDENEKPTGHNAYFCKLVFRITAQELIDMGYLTPPVVGATEDHYKTAALELNNMGRFKADQVEKAFEGHGRKTAAIVENIVTLAAARKGVIIFAATVHHAEEVLASLPQHNSAIVTGNTPKKERETILSRFKAKRLKYVVNVAVLTTGFDAPHVDLIAILRATESPGLLQQIIGRGLRLDEGKEDCLVLDYAENIDRHCPDGEVFNPDVEPPRKPGEVEPLEATCPECSTQQTFNRRKNPEQFDHNEHGYFVDLAGQATEMPAHYGRRCTALIKVGFRYERCQYRWTLKECPECAHENDIAARRCESCKAEIVDPNEKLRIEYKKIKRSPDIISTDKVLSWSCQKWISGQGNISIKVDYVTEYRTFSAWFSPNKGRQWNELCFIVLGKIVAGPDEFVAEKEKKEITTVTAKKNRATGFFYVYGHNEVEDEVPA